MPIMLELFSGSKVMSEEFKKAGYDVYTVDWNEEYKPSLVKDISTLSKDDVLKLCGGKPDIIWASPDCTTFSVCAIGQHRFKNIITKELQPTSEYAKFCDECNQHVLQLIRDLNPKYYFIENPRGGLRKMKYMSDIPRYTITYCQYGDKRMKPTDIWTNHPKPNFKPMCKRGDSCHESSPRGSKNGTNGLGNSYERSKIPIEFCKYIVKICEE